jgi:outer membrane protein TolC
VRIYAGCGEISDYSSSSAAWARLGCALALLCLGLPLCQVSAQTEGKTAHDEELSVLKLGINPELAPIDLATALRLAGVNNLQILLARQRVTEAVAERQFAAAQLLPSLHLGTSYDDHNGNLQQSDGNILKVDRESVYFGGGAFAVAAGTVNIPGVGWNLNLSEAVYGGLMARQYVEQVRFASRAVENEMLRRVAVAYTDLLRAEGRRALAIKVRAEAGDVERITAVFAAKGAGRDADKQRATAEVAHREADVLDAEGQVLQSSARLAELLNLDPSTRLHSGEDRVVPAGLVPAMIPLPDLLAIALLNRPELQERRAAIRQALLALHSAKMLPFSPNVIVGLSYGGFGGGSNLIAEPPGSTPFSFGVPRFDSYAERLDFDAIAYWTLQHLGVANCALVRQARGNLKVRDYEFIAQLDTVGTEVARAAAASQARFAQIDSALKALQQIQKGYELDYQASMNRLNLPIELLNSLVLLARSRFELLDAVIRYNQAQIDLFVALGQPPADVLARDLPAPVQPGSISNGPRPATIGRPMAQPKDGR